MRHLAMFCTCFLSATILWGAEVLTQHNDVSRSGVNVYESLLTTSNVNQTQFGKLFTQAVDAQIYSQPLYVANLNVQGRRNVVFVATEGNSVYAFDADNASVSAPLWSVNLGTPVPTAYVDCGTDLAPQIGITSTPVIDLSTRTLYVDAKSTDSLGYHHKLHALDLATGAEKFGGPVEVTAQASGTGLGNVSNVITFDPRIENQRSALLLSRGTVYLTFGSHCDQNAFHGWVLAYSAQSGTLQQTAVFLTTPNGSEGGIWEGGQGPAADFNGNVFAMTGNGTFDYSTGGPDLGDSVLKLSPSLSVEDYFAPSDQSYLNSGDRDLGAGGLLLLPHLVGRNASLAIGGGKEGNLYLLNRNNLGHYNTADAVVQEWGATAGPIYSSPIYWDNWLYIWSVNDRLRQYAWSNGVFLTSPTYLGPTSTVPFPGGVLALSANGTVPGSAILWATTAATGDPHRYTSRGILHAYDASNVSVELWNSYMNQARDDFGNLAKFTPPTVVNGKVFMATFSNQLAVYGLLSTPGAPSSLTASAPTRAVVLTWTASTGTAPIVGYAIFRTTGSQTTKIGTSTATSFIDYQTSRGATYSYYVQAYDAYGNYSAPSTPATINTAPSKTARN